jgi:predicted Zn-dependent protease
MPSNPACPREVKKFVGWGRKVKKFCKSCDNKLENIAKRAIKD